MLAWCGYFKALWVLGTPLVCLQPAYADMWTFVDDHGAKHSASTYVPTGAAGRSVTSLELSPGFMAIKPLVRTAADANQLDMALLQAVIAAESGFDSAAVSPKGAVGLMQVMPATAQRYGLASDKGGSVSAKLADPRTNINTGARYLRDLMNLFPGQLELAVAAYNAGEGAVQRAGNKIPVYKETQNYVRSVMHLYNRLNPKSQRMVASMQLAPSELSN